MSTESCGCDAGSGWICLFHQGWEAALIDTSKCKIGVIVQRQSRSHSFLETSTNIGVGLLLSFILQFTLYPLVGVEMTVSTNIIAVLAFTILSFARGYILRRIFNGFQG